jgi:photosystem II stability/assembly factor-like uncharacterized protein
VNKFWTVLGIALILSGCESDYLVWDLPRFNAEDVNDNSDVNQETIGSISNDLNKIQFVDNSTAYVAGDGIIIKSTDGGQTWKKIKASNTVKFTALYFVTPGLGYVGGNDQYYSYLYRTTDGGVTWEELTDFWFQNETNRVAEIFASSPGDRIVALINQYPNASQVNGHFAYSSDAGSSWSTFGANSRDPGFNAADLIDGKIIIGGNSDWTGSAYRTGVFETSFLLNGSPEITEYQVDNPIDFSSLDMVSSYGYGSAESGQFAITSDGGQNWTVKTVQGLTAVNFTAVAFSTEATGYLSTAGGEILMTQDFGQSWDSFYQFSDFVSDMDFRPDGKLFVVGKKGLLKSLD